MPVGLNYISYTAKRGQSRHTLRTPEEVHVTPIGILFHFFRDDWCIRIFIER